MKYLCQKKYYVFYLLILLLGSYNHPNNAAGIGLPVHVNSHFTHSLTMTTAKMKPSRNVLLFLVFYFAINTKFLAIFGMLRYEPSSAIWLAIILPVMT